MKFEEILPHLRAGKKVRRKMWKEHIQSIDLTDDSRLLFKIDTLKDDWEVIEEPKPKKKKVKLYAYISKDILRYKNCLYDINFIASKDYGSSAFIAVPELDQEIEVTEE